MKSSDETKKPKRGGGPRSAQGKQTSSQNSTTHGCCSKQLLVRGETIEQFEAVQETWIERYHPGNAAELEFVRQVIYAAWRLRRTEGVFDQYEHELLNAKDRASDWTEAELQLLQRLERYKTSARNDFHKAIRTIEAIQKSDSQKLDNLERQTQQAIVEQNRPKNERAQRQHVRSLVFTPVNFPIHRTDGGCGCCFCVRSWGISTCKPTPPEAKQN